MLGGSTRSMTCFFTSARSSSIEMASECCVEMTTASIRTGLLSKYSTLTWLLPSGRESTVPARRTSLNCRTSLCASMIGSGIHSTSHVIGVANIIPLIARPAESTPMAISGDWPNRFSTPHVFESKPKSALLYPIWLIAIL